MKIALMLLVMTALVSSYWWSQYKHPQPKWSDLQYAFTPGENHYTNTEVVNKLLIQKWAADPSTHKEKLVLSRLESMLSQDQMLEAAEVYVTVDGQLRAELTQKQPWARVVDSTRAFYLDRQGNTMPLSGLHAARVPIVTGEINPQTMKACYELLSFARQNEVLSEQLIGVHIEKNQKFTLALAAVDYQVHLGDLSDLPGKMARLVAINNKLAQDTVPARYKKIDLSFDHQAIGIK
jgi:cell division protein FtsQ